MGTTISNYWKGTSESTKKDILDKVEKTVVSSSITYVSKLASISPPTFIVELITDMVIKISPYRISY